jgi:hypothetical protein
MKKGINFSGSTSPDKRRTVLFFPLLLFWKYSRYFHQFCLFGLFSHFGFSRLSGLFGFFGLSGLFGFFGLSGLFGFSCLYSFSRFFC